MKEVSKEVFYDSFKNLNVTTGCPVNHKVWEVRDRYSRQLMAKSVKDENGDEKYYIKQSWVPDSLRIAHRLRVNR